MKQEFILLTVFIIAAAFVALLSLYGIKISKNDEPNYPYSHSYRYMCSVVGLFCSILFSILSVISFFVGGFNPENRTETKTEAVTSVEKKDDIMTIHNNDNYKIIIDFGNNYTEVYQNGKKLEGVRVRGPQWLMQYQIEDLKSNKSVIKTDYNITRKGDLKSIEVYISKNKNKDNFEIKY